MKVVVVVFVLFLAFDPCLSSIELATNVRSQQLAAATDISRRQQLLNNNNNNNNNNDNNNNNNNNNDNNNNNNNNNNTTTTPTATTRLSKTVATVLSLIASRSQQLNFEMLAGLKIVIGFVAVVALVFVVVIQIQLRNEEDFDEEEYFSMRDRYLLSDKRIASIVAIPLFVISISFSWLGRESIGSVFGSGDTWEGFVPAILQILTAACACLIEIGRYFSHERLGRQTHLKDEKYKTATKVLDRVRVVMCTLFLLFVGLSVVVGPSIHLLAHRLLSSITMCLLSVVSILGGVQALKEGIQSPTKSEGSETTTTLTLFIAVLISILSILSIVAGVRDSRLEIFSYQTSALFLYFLSSLLTDHVMTTEGFISANQKVNQKLSQLGLLDSTIVATPDGDFKWWFKAHGEETGHECVPESVIMLKGGVLCDLVMTETVTFSVFVADRRAYAEDHVIRMLDLSDALALLTGEQQGKYATFKTYQLNMQEDSDHVSTFVAPPVTFADARPRHLVVHQKWENLKLDTEKFEIPNVFHPVNVYNRDESSKIPSKVVVAWNGKFTESELLERFDVTKSFAGDVWHAVSKNGPVFGAKDGSGTVLANIQCSDVAILIHHSEEERKAHSDILEAVDRLLKTANKPGTLENKYGLYVLEAIGSKFTANGIVAKKASQSTLYVHFYDGLPSKLAKTEPEGWDELPEDIKDPEDEEAHKKVIHPGYHSLIKIVDITPKQASLTIKRVFVL